MWQPRGLSIRSLVVGVLILVCIGSNGLVFHYVSREHKLIEQAVIATTKEQGRSWSSLCSVASEENDRARHQEIVDAIQSGEGVLGAAIANSSGFIIAASDASLVGTSVPQGDLPKHLSSEFVEERHPNPTGFFHESGHNFRFSFPFGDRARQGGFLTLEINTAQANKSVKGLAMSGLLMAFLLTLAFVVGAVLLDWRLRRAVGSLIEATHAIAEGEVPLRIDTGTGDELEVLGKSVSHMADALKSSETRIRHWHRELEETIAARTEELEASQMLLAQREKMAALGLMAAGIAHEVGNPLAAVFAMVQGIERRAPPELQQKCKDVRSEIQRVCEIVDDIKHFARPVSKSGAAVNINEIARLSIKTCRYDPRAKNVNIETDLNPDLPAIPGNGDRWQQVFLNLISNALDAMPDGGQLMIASRLEEGRVKLVVRDTGVGMDAEKLRNLFHPFYSTKAPGEGLGLGLSVCAGIVRSYGGEIHVEGSPRQGTEFTITVPLAGTDTDPGRTGSVSGPGGTRDS